MIGEPVTSMSDASSVGRNLHHAAAPAVAALCNLGKGLALREAAGGRECRTTGFRTFYGPKEKDPSIIDISWTLPA